MLDDYKVMAQVAIVVHDINQKSKAFAEFLGVDVPEPRLTGTYDEANTHYMGEPTEARAKLAFFELDNIQIELIEPVGGPSTWQNALDEHGEGVHHIAFWVKDLDKEILRLEGQGIKLEQKGDFTGGGYAYMDASSKLGCVLELLTHTEE
ncbi:MAG: VOC family protein [Anaerolineaceae bacterium]|nr:VOC family protein [Anaerolineaceae bacterium]